MNPRELLDRLLAAWGPQAWWPGDDTFEIALGAILTQRTSWRNATQALGNLRAAGVLAPAALLQCDDAGLEAMLRPCGFFRVKAARVRHFCRWLDTQGGMDELREWPTPELREALLAIHGIGPETADAILLYACGRPVFVADAYAFRLLGRLGVIEARRPRYEAVRRQIESALGDDLDALNELHALIVRHGQAICRPAPLCMRCGLSGHCNFGASLQRPTTMHA